MQALDYALDPAGNITGIVNLLDANRGQSFGYDALNRLTSADGLYGDMSYDYDALGNRIERTDNGQTDLYAYDTTSHRLADITGANANTYTYDANGNTTAQGPYDYTYSDSNRLTEVFAGATLTVEYTYNAKGERVKKSANGERTLFHYDQGGHLIAETDEADNTLTEYVYLEDLRLAVLAPGAPSGNGAPIEVDNTAPTVTHVGDWTLSSVVSGYAGANYHQRLIVELGPLVGYFAKQCLVAQAQTDAGDAGAGKSTTFGRAH